MNSVWVFEFSGQILIDIRDITNRPNKRIIMQCVFVQANDAPGHTISTVSYITSNSKAEVVHEELQSLHFLSVVLVVVVLACFAATLMRAKC
jgi:ABC-type transport system involved in multi-copper enzyme maturation permease subunit